MPDFNKLPYLQAMSIDGALSPCGDSIHDPLAPWQKQLWKATALPITPRRSTIIKNIFISEIWYNSVPLYVARKVDLKMNFLPLLLFRGNGKNLHSNLFLLRWAFKCWPS